MKPYTNDTQGSNLYFYSPKEHKVPKSSKDRRGSRSGMRQQNQLIIENELLAA
ncbi:hypothetical protein HNW13_018635 [Shewanella sp. BF02_Schw]|uniref:hypothetical protein n=1 Tax=Shewanella sp. BF02_Schw TaxID=394908 RepID=UPI001783242A|nr:hypothetical protein [Shewanella sp. BF02_Schw]MBO1897759.1 hypothetical protein [Shewanella sp. BF02_Schw]